LPTTHKYQGWHHCKGPRHPAMPTEQQKSTTSGPRSPRHRHPPPHTHTRTGTGCKSLSHTHVDTAMVCKEPHFPTGVGAHKRQHDSLLLLPLETVHRAHLHTRTHVQQKTPDKTHLRVVRRDHRDLDAQKRGVGQRKGGEMGGGGVTQGVNTGPVADPRMCVSRVTPHAREKESMCEWGRGRWWGQRKEEQRRAWRQENVNRSRRSPEPGAEPSQPQAVP
jgi:hypothetical protein